MGGVILSNDGFKSLEHSKKYIQHKFCFAHHQNTAALKGLL